MRVDTLVSGEGGSPVYTLLAEAVRSLVPTLEKLNIACAAQVKIDSLADRMRREVVAKRGIAMSYGLVGAWVTKPFPDEMVENWLGHDGRASHKSLRRISNATDESGLLSRDMTLQGSIYV
jgi:hypothetical protein